MRHPNWTPRGRLFAETPEDVYGPLILCSRCDTDYYSGYNTECPECGLDPYEETLLNRYDNDYER